MGKANVVKNREAIIIRFFNSLNRKIANIIELQYYIAIKNMAYIAIKIERELKRKYNTR